MPDTVGERLAALQASFDGFKDQVNEFKDRVKSDFTVLKWIFGLGVALISAIAGSQWLAIANVSKETHDLAVEVRGLKVRIDQMGQNVANSVSQEIAPKIAAISRPIVDGIREEVRNALAGAAPETLGTLSNVPILKDEERELIKKNIPVAKIAPDADKLELGDFIRDAAVLSTLNPVPDAIWKSVPQLQGLLFTVGDRKVLFARPRDNRIVALVAR